MEKLIEPQWAREPGDIIMEAAYRRWLAAGSPEGGFVFFWMKAEDEYERDALPLAQALSVPLPDPAVD